MRIDVTVTETYENGVTRALSQTTPLLVATVWIAGTPSDAVYCHKHNTVHLVLKLSPCSKCKLFLFG